MTLPELLVSMFVLSIVLIVFLGVLASVQTEVSAQQRRDDNNTQMRLAVEQMDRKIRSANIIYDPLVDDPAGFHLRVYTQSNGTNTCVEWRISGTSLQTRQRTPGIGLAWPATWSTVARNVVNVSNSVKAFQLDPDPSKSGRTLDIALLVNSTPSNSATLVRGTDAITGRDLNSGYDPSVCDPFPSD